MTTRANNAIVPLADMTAADEPAAGGKAYNCARLKQAGFRVPDGVAVLTRATSGDVASIASHPWFDAVAAETSFAVRSSGIGEDGAGESFAGIHETFLNVRRAELPAAVAACRASSRSPQALEYRRAKGLPADAIDMGVLIQQMVAPIAAGVAFSINPVSGRDDELVINSSWGLGEALVSGQVDPDEFVIAKGTGELKWSRIGQKGRDDEMPSPTLSSGQLSELGAILVDIERHYGAPQDVEWCLDTTGFWVVQSRPVTTGRAAANETEWTRANFAEVLPDITSPQALDAFVDLLTRAERRYLGGLIGPEETLGPIVKVFLGRLHFNLSQLRHICTITGMAPAEMLRSMGHAEAIQPADERPARKRLSTLKYAPDFGRLLWRQLTLARQVARHETACRAYERRLRSIDPRRLADPEIWAALDEWTDRGPEYMQLVLLLTSVTVHETPVRKFCETVGFPFEQLVYPQLASGERSVSAQQAFDLVALADTARREPATVAYLSREDADAATMHAVLAGTQFLAAFDAFLENYGHRGRYESDWSLPRYREDPTPILRAIRAHLMDPSPVDPVVTTARQERAAADAWTELEKRLTGWQRLTRLPRIRAAIRRIKQYYLWREQVRSDLIRVLGILRPWHLVLANRFVERGWIDRRDDYFLLHLSEIGAVIGGVRSANGLRAIAASRAAELERYRAIQMPLLMRPSELPSLIRTAGLSGGADPNVLTGHSVSGGSVEADVVVIRDPGDFDRMTRGAILVAPATDPSWTPLFTLASGVIVEVGGVLSHASTIAREYGLPALANVKQATRRLRTGERVRLDADSGIVQRLDAEKTSPAADAAQVSVA